MDQCFKFNLMVNTFAIDVILVCLRQSQIVSCASLVGRFWCPICVIIGNVSSGSGLANTGNVALAALVVKSNSRERILIESKLYCLFLSIGGYITVQ